jgi:peptidyl-prolyl cis-trans isomerase SurA
MMKKLTTKFLLLILLGLIATSGFADASLDKIVVIVNDSVITQREVNRAIAVAKQQLASTNTPLPDEKALTSQVIDSLIYRDIQQQMVTRADITVSGTELNNAIKDIAVRNHVSLSQLKNEVESNGLDYAEYRKNIGEQIAFGRLQQQAVGRDINVTDQEINAFLRDYKNVRQPNAQYHLLDILISLSDTPSPTEIEQAEQKAQKIVQQINDGANFNQLAAARSAGGEALHGGDLGWKKLAEMPIVFADKVRDMKSGQIAGPLKAPNGFHIIKLTGIKNSTQKLTRDQVRELIFRRKFAEKLQTWLQGLRAGAYVKFV